RHTRSYGDWSSDVCSSDLGRVARVLVARILRVARGPWTVARLAWIPAERAPRRYPGVPRAAGGPRHPGADRAVHAAVARDDRRCASHGRAVADRDRRPPVGHETWLD